MQHAVRVDVSEARRHVPDDRPRARVRRRRGEGLREHLGGERAALAQLHLHVHQVVLLPRAMVGDDVGMRRELVGRLGFLQPLGALILRLELWRGRDASSGLSRVTARRV